MVPHPFHKRLLKEYRSLVSPIDPREGILVINSDEDLCYYVFRVVIKENPLYPHSDEYYLHVRIPLNYPVDSPQVQFDRWKGLGSIPVHPHVYLNGHICLNILGSDWSPACSIESIVMSIQSMLSSNNKNERPPHDMAYSGSAPRNPKKTLFIYHDDSI